MGQKLKNYCIFRKPRISGKFPDMPYPGNDGNPDRFEIKHKMRNTLPMYYDNHTEFKKTYRI